MTDAAPDGTDAVVEGGEPNESADAVAGDGPEDAGVFAMS
jgi:hypothetical protein